LEFGIVKELLDLKTETEFYGKSAEFEKIKGERLGI